MKLGKPSEGITQLSSDLQKLRAIFQSLVRRARKKAMVLQEEQTFYDPIKSCVVARCGAAGCQNVFARWQPEWFIWVEWSR